MGEPIFSDQCVEPERGWQDNEGEPCHMVAGFTIGQASCGLWERVKQLCQTEPERRFLQSYLGLAKDRQFPMLIPQARIGIAERRRPDFVLLDIGLPGSDGFQVAEALRRDPGLAEVKIIAVTGRGAKEDRERSQEAGIDYYLLKPVDITFLESLLGKAILSG